MEQPQGLRERKKARTRRTLVETGLRLFDRQGYDATTVAQIAAAAEVAPATFFTYFPAKEDLVFAQQPERLQALHAAIADRAPGDSVADVLLRGARLLLESDDWSIESDTGLSAVRARLVAEEPSLRAAALRRLFDIQDELAGTLARAFPDELDDIAAHAVIGSVVGAVISTAMSAVRRGAPETVPQVAIRAAQIALAGTA
ncbi:TetR/AcrR family transcriptional regulator [Allonocardiopsis opalescens]|uniref:TetR family transcriptional regulator n=1 Tax=Allonocardiopsis opalescens TaxID=1144618 RepID=A0A2T0Q9B1_9ACTN|nr:TetR family transcriptional regulator [Allonocardiopsis opalescens]PRY00444.1 TetR family transcriptional regulator [Allonocardiopsis opalescens]